MEAALALKAVIGTSKHSQAVINNEIFEAGEEQPVRVPNGHVRVRCIEIGGNYVLVQVEGEAGPKRLLMEQKKELTQHEHYLRQANDETASAIMKTKNIFALIVVVLAPCLATVAQTTTTPASAHPIRPEPATTAPSPSGPGDALAKPPEAAVVAHGTAPDQAPVPVVSLTNELGDEILDTVTFDGIPLPDAVRALALQAGLNIQFDPKLLNTVGPDGHSIPISPPTITEKWKKVTAKQALTSLLDNWGWQLVMDPRTPIGRITAKDPTALEPLVTRSLSCSTAIRPISSPKFSPRCPPAVRSSPTRALTN